MGYLLLLSMVTAGLAYALLPHSLSWNLREGELTLEQALALEDALWVDARQASEYAQGTYGQALLVNEEAWEDGFADLLGQWSPGSPIVVFCSSQSCLRSHDVAKRLRVELGVEEVYVLSGGWEVLQDLEGLE